MTTTKRALPKPLRRQIHIRQLGIDVDEFQPRRTGMLENHVAELLNAVNRGDKLDPLAVWEDPNTKKWIVADGHHRLEAYRRAKVRGKIAVDVFICDRATAMLIPIKENAKKRASLPDEDKRNWAWRMTIEGSWSKADTVAACGVGDGTVGRMRRIMNMLKKRDIELPAGWYAAQAAERGDEERTWTEDAREEWRCGLIDKADRQFGSSFAHLCGRSPEAAAEFLVRCAGGSLTAMLDSIGYIGVDEDCNPYGDVDGDFTVDEDCDEEADQPF